MPSFVARHHAEVFQAIVCQCFYLCYFLPEITVGYFAVVSRNVTELSQEEFRRLVIDVLVDIVLVYIRASMHFAIPVDGDLVV